MDDSNWRPPNEGQQNWPPSGGGQQPQFGQQPQQQFGQQPQQQFGQQSQQQFGQQPHNIPAGAASYTPAPKKKSRLPLILGGIFGFLFLMCGGFFVWFVATDLSPDDQRALARACDGAAVPGAGSYQGGTDGFMAFTQMEEGDEWDRQVNSASGLKKPSSLEEAQTVLCLDPPTQILVDVCAYGKEGSSETEVIEVYAYDRQARLVNPSTGQVIATHIVTNNAEECPDSFYFDDSFSGTPPSVDSFDEWVLGQLNA